MAVHQRHELPRPGRTAWLRLSMRATRHVVQDLGTTKQSEGKEIGVCAKTKAEVKVEVEVEEEKVADRFVAAGQINQQLERQGQAPDQIFQVESVVARVEDGQISPIKRKKAHSTTNFFFKSKAKHVLSKVKTVLENVQHSTSRMEGFPVEDASNEAVVACATSGVGSPKNGQIEIDSSENDDDYRDDDDKVEIISKNDKETLILPGGDALGEEWQVDPLLLENTSQRTLVPSERLELCITVLDDFPYFEGDKYPHRYEYKLLSVIDGLMGLIRIFRTSHSQNSTKSTAVIARLISLQRYQPLTNCAYTGLQLWHLWASYLVA